MISRGKLFWCLRWSPTSPINPWQIVRCPLYQKSIFEDRYRPILDRYLFGHLLIIDRVRSMYDRCYWHRWDHLRCLLTVWPSHDDHECPDGNPSKWTKTNSKYVIYLIWEHWECRYLIIWLMRSDVGIYTCIPYQISNLDMFLLQYNNLTNPIDKL